MSDMVSGRAAEGPDFSRRVRPGGYGWWYLDAFSADFTQGLSVIAMIGSPFSPWYAWARRRGAARAENHCAVNVALYAGGRHHWCLTERGAGSLLQKPGLVAIGGSTMRWEAGTLIVSIDEVTAPVPRRVRGTIRLTPDFIAGHTMALDPAGCHTWRAIAPRAGVEVRLSHPARRWDGFGYFDTNWGERPLEADFAEWHWSRTRLADGAAVTYDVVRTGGTRQDAAIRYDMQGGSQMFQAPPARDLRPGFWRMRRLARGETDIDLAATLEDSPFYARSLLRTQLCGEAVTCVHESLSLRRFDTAWMRMLLPFKAPRALWRAGQAAA